MRGQLTFEYLVLSLVAVALISFSVLALASVKESADRTLAVISFASSAQRLEAAMGEACALGSGNSRSVYLEPELGIRCSGEGATVSWAGGSYSFRVSCPVEGAEGLRGKVNVANRGGTIVVSG